MKTRLTSLSKFFARTTSALYSEEGNLRFDVLQDPEVNSRFYIYEAYKDEDAVAFHKTTPHYKTCVAKLESLMTGPRKKRLFNGLMP